MIDAKHLAKTHVAQNIPLNYDEAYELGCLAVDSCNIVIDQQVSGQSLTNVTQTIALLSALHNQATYAWQYSQNAQKLHDHRLPKTAAEQIAGICVAVFNHDIANSDFGFLNPKVEYVMDNCGMGGDLIVTANISTIAGFIAAAADIPMCKHGSPANADQGHYGSSDFISLICGINVNVSKGVMEECIAENKFGYTEALDTRYKHIHTQTHKIALIPHMNDIIGPITNPIHPHKIKRRVLGINHLMSPQTVAEAYQILNGKDVTRLEHGLFVRGFISKDSYEGIDEVSICEGGTKVAELKNGQIREFYLYAEDFGLKPIPSEAVSPPKGVNKGEYSLQILRGEIDGPRLQIVLANASLLFYLAGHSTDLKECYRMAEKIFQSGQAYKKMLAVKEMLAKQKEVLC